MKSDDLCLVKGTLCIAAAGRLIGIARQQTEWSANFSLLSLKEFIPDLTYHSTQ